MTLKNKKIKKEADSPLRRRCRSYYYQNHVTQEFNYRINSKFYLILGWLLIQK